MQQEDINLTREDWVRIVGEELVHQAETMPNDRFQTLKWERLPDLLRHATKLTHTPLFEARRSYLLGLDATMQRVLIRHLGEEREEDL